MRGIKRPCGICNDFVISTVSVDNAMPTVFKITETLKNILNRQKLFNLAKRTKHDFCLNHCSFCWFDAGYGLRTSRYTMTPLSSSRTSLQWCHSRFFASVFLKRQRPGWGCMGASIVSLGPLCVTIDWIWVRSGRSKKPNYFALDQLFGASRCLFRWLPAGGWRVDLSDYGHSGLPGPSHCWLQ